MSLSRRDFVKLCTGTVAGYGVSTMFHPAVHQALAETLTGERPPVFWIQGAGCTGCSVTILNSTHPAIADVLLKVISLEYHPTIMAGDGAPAVEYMLKMAAQNKGKYFVVVEGAIPVAEEGKFCIVAEANHKEYTMVDMLKELAPDAAAILAVGTCACFGGVSAAEGTQTQSLGTSAFLQEVGIATPVVNISGCPPHPDWIVGTLVLALETIKKEGLEQGLATVVTLLDSDGRPTPFYGVNTHEMCPLLPQFEEGTMSSIITDKEGCRYDLGCKGPMAMCDSATRRWNGKVNWCIENALCIGCVESDFPDGKSPFYY